MFYVYILQSLVDLSFYKGYSLNPLQRLEAHNKGESNYTSKKMPWILVAVFAFETKKEAIIKEKKLKKYGHDKLSDLIKSDLNIVQDFIN
jgi:putative endonuclease